ncbi:hypothetical protein [Marivita sp.]|uniref:hypothetical protein n=1 Tax=Marivita sp. TaxID=2003365 RepID=UPI003F718FE6
MTPNKALYRIRQDFRYVSDDKRDRWVIGPFEGPFEGDCEDFALTLLMRIADSEAIMWVMLAKGDARIEHVLSDRGNGHAVLWVKDAGYVDSIHQVWRPERMFEHEFTYSSAQIRKKLSGKTVRKPANKGLMLVALACAAFAFFTLTQRFR